MADWNTGRPRQIAARYHNDNAVASSGGITVIQENLYLVAGLPAISGNTLNPVLSAFDASIDNDQFGLHHVRYTLTFDCTGNGDCLIIYSAPMALPFVFGTNEGTIYQGFANSAAAGDAKCVDMTIIGGGDVLTQALSFAIHDCVAGQSYTATVTQSFVN